MDSLFQYFIYFAQVRDRIRLAGRDGRRFKNKKKPYYIELIETAEMNS